MSNENQDPAVEFLREHLEDDNLACALEMWESVPPSIQMEVWATIRNETCSHAKMLAMGTTMGTATARNHAMRRRKVCGS